MPCLAKTLEADDIRPKRGSTYHKLVCPGNGVVAFASALGWYSSGSRAERRRERSGQGGSEKEGARKAEVRRGGDAERGDEVEEEEGGGAQDVHLSSMGLREEAGSGRHYTIVGLACPLLGHGRHVGTGRCVNHGSRSSR